MTQNEFTRAVRLDTIGQAAHILRFAAAPEERAALAERFALAALDRLDVEAAVRREAGAVFAEGRVTAQVVQSCVATGRPLPVTVEAPFSLRFVPETGNGSVEEEIELTDADCDTLTYTGSAIDLGEAAAETLLLALDPFPRSADADALVREAGVIAEEEVATIAAVDKAEASPFAALKALKDKLEG